MNRVGMRDWSLNSKIRICPWSRGLEGCTKSAENINQAHWPFALRERGLSLGTCAFPKVNSTSKEERSPWRGAEASGRGWESSGGHTWWCTRQWGAQQQAESGGETAAHRSGRAHVKSGVSSGLAQMTWNGLNLLWTTSWEPWLMPSAMHYHEGCSWAIVLPW